VEKYVFVPPPRRDLWEMRRGKERPRKKNREVGEGDDVVIIEDNLDDEDEETLQEWFQLRSRFSQARMLDIPVIIKKPASLEASLSVPPSKPHNVARKRAAKKLKISEATSQEVSTMSGVVEYLQ
jgi:hypothetical protein